MLSQINHGIITYLNTISDVIPLPWFTFLGSIIEEIIAPIPSPLVMTLAGSIAATNHQTWVFLIGIALTGAFGKTLASYLMYVIADKFEDIVLSKFGVFLGVSHREVERIGKHLNKGWRDDIVLIILRTIPIIPSAPISIVCGLIKLNMRTFFVSTFVGTTFRNLIYLAVGFTGVNATESIIVAFEDLEIVGYVLIALIVLVVMYVLVKHKKEKLLQRLLGENESSEENA